MSSIDFEAIKNQLLVKAESILLDLCPGGKRQGKYYQAGTTHGGPGKSFSFDLEKGSWIDFATQEKGGDLIALYAHNNNLSQIDAAKSLQERYLGANQDRIVVPSKKPPKQTIFIKPPTNVTPPYQLKNYDTFYTYTDENNNPIFYVGRKKNSDGSKTFHPYSYTQDNEWVPKIKPHDREIYNQAEFHNQKNILIVEGEKAAEAAKTLCPNYTVTTWHGGVNAALKSNWNQLKDRSVLLWPDNDQEGLTAMTELAAHLINICSEVKIIELNEMDKEKGWDAADALSEGWSYQDFLNFARPRAKVIQKLKGVQESSVKNEAVISAGFPNKSRKGFKPLATIENFKYLMDQYGVTIRYNVITKEEEILIPNESFLIDNRANASIAWVVSTMAKHEMPIGQANDFIAYLTGVNLYNPVAEWIESKPWDKTIRIKDLYETVTVQPVSDLVEHTKNIQLKELFIRKWMISAIAAVFNPNGVSAHGVLVFQGDQNIGKTSWLNSLAPKEMNLTKDGVLLRPDDKDSVKQTVSHWLVELGELDATFKRSDIAQLKGFLTKDRDVLRRAFARKESEYARRTVFFASVNPRQFLQDPTGNRRFWTIECQDINFKHGLDMQQVWAEVYENHYLKGEKWWLDETEIQLLNEHNEDFMSLDPTVELIQERLNWDDPESVWTEKTVTEVLIECGIKKPSKAEANIASNLIKKLNGNKVTKTKAARLLKVPNLKYQYRRQEEF